jgi:hypothetical protein
MAVGQTDTFTCLATRCFAYVFELDRRTRRQTGQLTVR